MSKINKNNQGLSQEDYDNLLTQKEINSHYGIAITGLLIAYKSLEKINNDTNTSLLQHFLLGSAAELAEKIDTSDKKITHDSIKSLLSKIDGNKESINNLIEELDDYLQELKN